MAYEYKEVLADDGQVSFLIDSYENFGWEPDENVMPRTLEKYPERAGKGGHRKRVLRLKRDRRIVNKTELTRLCLLYTSPSPRDQRGSRMPSSA